MIGSDEDPESGDWVFAEEQDWYVVCPMCEERKLQKPPDNSDWQVSCAGCRLIKFRLFDPCGPEIISYFVNGKLYSEEEFQRVLKLKAWM